MNLVYIFSLILSLIHCTNMKRWKLVEVSLMTFKKISFLMPVFCFDKFHMKISSKKVSLHFRLKIYQQLRSSSKQPMMSHTTEKNKLGSLELSRCKKWVWQNSVVLQMADSWIAVRSCHAAAIIIFKICLYGRVRLVYGEVGIRKKKKNETPTKNSVTSFDYHLINTI